MSNLCGHSERGPLKQPLDLYNKVCSASSGELRTGERGQCGDGEESGAGFGEDENAAAPSYRRPRASAHAREYTQEEPTPCAHEKTSADLLLTWLR